MNHRCNLVEGIERGDLVRVVDPRMNIDEHRSKMGEDKDIVVIGFTVMGKEPADDLISFIEKSYDWVLDADVSSGETSDGNYVVFVEIERKPQVAEEIMKLMTDMMNLTEQKLSDWTFTYYKDKSPRPMTLDELQTTIIATPEKYEERVGDNVTESRKLNTLRSLAGVFVKPPRVIDEAILRMQRAAGIK